MASPSSPSSWFQRYPDPSRPLWKSRAFFMHASVGATTTRRVLVSEKRSRKYSTPSTVDSMLSTVTLDAKKPSICPCPGGCRSTATTRSAPITLSISATSAPEIGELFSPTLRFTRPLPGDRPRVYCGAPVDRLYP